MILGRAVSRGYAALTPGCDIAPLQGAGGCAPFGRDGFYWVAPTTSDHTGSRCVPGGRWLIFS